MQNAYFDSLGRNMKCWLKKPNSDEHIDFNVFQKRWQDGSLVLGLSGQKQPVIKKALITAQKKYKLLGLKRNKL